MKTRITLLAGVAGVAAALALVLAHRGADSPARAAEPTAPIAAPRRVHTPPRMPALAAVETAKDGDRDRLHEEAYRALVERLRNDPEATIAELEQFLGDADPTKLSTQVAIGALVGVGTPATQAALIRVIRGRDGDEGFALAAIPVVGFLATPTAETEAAIRALAQGGATERVQNSSHLALGTMASRLAHGEAGRATAIVADYAARLAAAETPNDRRRWLMVLGNARTEASASAVSALLGDPDPTIRRTAVESLRLAPSADVEAKLTGALVDGDPGVRAGAAWSLKYRTLSPAATDATLGRLAVEREDSVVTALLDVLWPRRDDRVIAAVTELAHHHPSNTIRARAQKLLDSV